MIALFAMGFRPFFLGAVLWGLACMAVWSLAYAGLAPYPGSLNSPFLWHGHAMILGFSMAVIAGFLLTAVRNWTGQPLPTGPALAGLFCLWLLARTCLFISIWLSHWQWAGLVLDAVFILILLLVLSRPVIHIRQWRQIPILSKLALIGISHIAFSLAVLSQDYMLAETALLSAFYLILALILTIARRIFPFFSKGAAGRELPNQLWADRLSLFGLLIFWLAECLQPAHPLGNLAALAVCVANGARLIYWYYPALWSSPLLWGLYLSLAGITAGFFLMALRQFADGVSILALHTLAITGIGMITFSMMGRVSIGHTGRMISHPPALLTASLIVMLAAALLRVLPQLLAPSLVHTGVIISGLLWVLASLLFLSAYLPMLIFPRVDGKPG